MSTGSFTPLTIRVRYADYVFDTILSVYDPRLRAPQSFDLQWTSWICSGYFPASSLNRTPSLPPQNLNGWVFALWNIRTELGPDFTDRALVYTLRAPADYSEDFNDYFRKRFTYGVLAVKNDFSQVLAVNKILKRHKLL